MKKEQKSRDERGSGYLPILFHANQFNSIYPMGYLFQVVTFTKRMLLIALISFL